MRTPDTLTSENIVSFLAEIFERHCAKEYLGEAVTVAEHMLQSAHFAEQRGEAEAIIVAALLHDIGHFTGESGTFCMRDTEDRYHEKDGAALLQRFFPLLVTDCVRHHVAAKRYLCARDPGYLARLSDASLHSLSLQGGPMSAEEVTAFEDCRNHDAVIKVRRLDDEGKVAGLKTPPFAHFAPMIQRLVDVHRENAAA